MCLAFHAHWVKLEFSLEIIDVMKTYTNQFILTEGVPKHTKLLWLVAETIRISITVSVFSSEMCSEASVIQCVCVGMSL